MMKLQIASIPFFPSTSRKSCPMGNAKSVLRRSDTDAVANEAAMRINHPRVAVPAAPTIIAIGAAFAALVVSSEMCAAESSAIIVKEVPNQTDMLDTHIQ